jgi:hypothetical protein
MVATMEKADKQYQCEDLNQIDWSAIKGITKKPIPSIAQKMVKDVIKLTPKKYKAPYAKLGIVNGDTVLRIKDGSTHVADLILVEAGETPVAKPGPQVTNAEQREIDRYRQAKEDLPGQVKIRYQAMERDLQQLDQLTSRIADDCAAIVKRVSYTQQEELQAILDRQQQAHDLLQALQDQKDNTTTQLMNPHRNGDFAAAPEAAKDDLRKELLSLAGKCWTLANATFSKMEGLIKRGESQCRLADNAVQTAQSSLQGNISQGQAALKTLTDTTVELETELGKITQTFTAKNTAFHLIEFINNKTEGVINAANLDIKHTLLDQVVMQLKIVSGKTKQVNAGLDQIHSQATVAIRTVSKPNQSHQLVKPILARLVKVQKDSEAAKKSWAADLAKAAKGFENIKALVGTDKGEARKVEKQNEERLEKRNKEEQKQAQKKQQGKK